MVTFAPTRRDDPGVQKIMIVCVVILPLYEGMIRPKNFDLAYVINFAPIRGVDPATLQNYSQPRFFYPYMRG